MAWQKWITTQQLIWCLSQCSTYIFIHCVWHSMDESIARLSPVTDRKRTFQFNALMYILTFLFIIFSIHHIHVMNRHPAGAWYGKLDILWFMKRGVFIFHFYSWALDLVVNAFKTDSALLVSWIKTMLPSSRTTGCSRWPLKEAWASSFPWHSWELYNFPVQPTDTFQRLLYVHDIYQLVTMAEIPPSIWQFPHQEEYDSFRYLTSHLNHVIICLNVVILVVLLKSSLLSFK